MARKTLKKSPPTGPAKPFNRWVRDAIGFAGISQSELARRLFERRVISNNDRSIVNKMTLTRDVSAAEMYAIAEITGFPAPAEAAHLSTVPLLGWISAGALADDSAPGEVLETLTIADLPKGDWIALRVNGDSMDRISPPDSIIVVDRTDRRLVANACYVIADENGEATYKRYRPSPMRFEPVSTNSDHEPLFPDQEPLIVGRVRRSMLDM